MEVQNASAAAPTEIHPQRMTCKQHGYYTPIHTASHGPRYTDMGRYRREKYEPWQDKNMEGDNGEGGTAGGGGNDVQ